MQPYCQCFYVMCLYVTYLLTTFWTDTLFLVNYSFNYYCSQPFELFITFSCYYVNIYFKSHFTGSSIIFTIWTVSDIYPLLWTETSLSSTFLTLSSASCSVQVLKLIQHVFNKLFFSGCCYPYIYSTYTHTWNLL